MKAQKILPLIFEPNPLLHIKSELVTDITTEIKRFCNNLVNTMQHYKGLGLAAVQVGVLKAIIAVNIINTEEDNNMSLNLQEGPRILINPIIIEASLNDKKQYAEGCLSYGNVFPEIERFNKIKVRYLDIEGQINFLEISDHIMSSCIQHEIDHTNGIVFLDRLSRIKKEFMMKKYIKWRKSQR